MKQNTPEKARLLTPRLLAFAALGAYFTVVFFGGLANTGDDPLLSPDFVVHIHPLTYALAFLILGGILLAYGSISRRMVYGYSWIACALYALRTAIAGGSYYLTYAMCGLLALMTLLVGRAMHAEPRKNDRAPRTMSTLAAKIVIIVPLLVGVGISLFLLLSSYLTYTTQPAVSTGVYAQLMHALRDGFSFDTTLEFGRPVSHFAAHISPAFLLYLPFYALIPSPVTLIVLQTLAVYSAVIPLYLLCRQRGLSTGLTAVVCSLLCLSPAVWIGAAGSLHEYALLLPLLLWLLWALAVKRTVPAFIFAAACLLVRETAAIHVAAVGLYHMLSNAGKTANDVERKSVRRRGLILCLGAILYFGVAFSVLTYAGEGTLITRFENITGPYATDILTLLREIIYNPALALYEMLAEAKILYVFSLLLPVAFLPLLSRKKAGLVFLIPLLLLNLLSDFPYHYQLDFPYSFGVTAFVLHLTVDALGVLGSRANVDKETNGRSRRVLRRVALLSVCFTLIISASRLAEHALFVEYVFDGGDEVAVMDSLLEKLDEEASVSASARLCPNLAGRDELYILSQGVETDVIVLDLRAEWQIGAEKDYTIDYYQKMGYTVTDTQAGILAILEKG